MLFSFLLSLRIAVILEKNQKQSFVLCSIRKRLLILILYKNIDIPPKSPFNPPKGGFSSFAPRYSSSKLDSALGLASVGKGGLGRFAPGATIKRVSWLRSTANAVKIANG